jgi:hypothetical protein
MNFHTDFHSACTSLHSHQKHMKVPFFPHPHQQFVWFLFLMTVIQIVVRWNVISIWFPFPFWERILNTSSDIYYPFLLLQRTDCLMYFPNYLLDCLFFWCLFFGSTCVWTQGLTLGRQTLLPLEPLHQPFWCLIFWALCIFWILTLYPCNCCQRLPHILWVTAWLW